MKIAIVGANGKSGKLLVEEAINRGHEVTAIVREGNVQNQKAKVLEKDLFELSYDDVKENEVIIDAFGVWTEDSLYLHQNSLQYLADMLSGKENRLVVVGSAGGLFLNAEHTLRLLDSPDMPEEYKPLSTAMTAAFDALKVRTDVKWTYFSPSAIFDPEGKREGKYRKGGDELLVSSKGQSYISYADGAIAILDEAEQGKHVKGRFTAVAV